ncbi:hypothetical protein BC940DRAFT_307455 [Gongronella butleri]|nr:hypothetical protein BC940DRAFT_307455 [Gongronella butleri]
MSNEPSRKPTRRKQPWVRDMVLRSNWKTTFRKKIDDKIEKHMGPALKKMAPIVTKHREIRTKRRLRHIDKRSLQAQACALFHKASMNEINPEKTLSNAQSRKIASERWTHMSEEEKTPYIKKALKKQGGVERKLTPVSMQYALVPHSMQSMLAQLSSSYHEHADQTESGPYRMMNRNYVYYLRPFAGLGLEGDAYHDTDDQRQLRELADLENDSESENDRELDELEEMSAFSAGEVNRVRAHLKLREELARVREQEAAESVVAAPPSASPEIEEENEANDDQLNDNGNGESDYDDDSMSDLGSTTDESDNETPLFL